MSTPSRRTLSDAERWALYAAAEAGGFSEDFGDILCQLGELVGFEEVLNELERVRGILADWPVDALD